MVLISPLQMNLGTINSINKTMKKKPIAKRDEEQVCSSCGCLVFFNLDIYERTGMCGTCTTGEARLNYEED